MTKREHMPLDYDPRLDRRQPPPLGCVKVVAVVGLLACVLITVAAGVSAHMANQAEPLPTVAALPSPTPDEATPEITPDASATPMPSATPDAWSMTGGAVWIMT